MDSATFSLVNYRFDKVEMNFSLSNEGDTWLISIVPQGLYTPEAGEYELSFLFQGKLGENGKSFIKVHCSAIFSFGCSIKLEEIPSYFYANSIAILFPYVRAFISTVTLQANIPLVLLPTYNLSSLQEELKNNTRVKC